MSKRAGGAAPDFTTLPSYRLALALCGQIYDLESKFPDDERAVLYAPLKAAGIAIGSFIASGAGRGGEAGLERMAEARAKLMEARHVILLARSRYLIDEADEAAFTQVYLDLLAALSVPPGGMA